MNKEIKTVRIVVEADSELQHLLRQVAAKRNRNIKETVADLIRDAARVEGILTEKATE